MQKYLVSRMGREHSYFEAGSIRDSARDEEFFTYFKQFLEEVI